MSQAIREVASELFNQFNNDSDYLAQFNIITVMITTEIEQKFPELKMDLKEEDDYFYLKRNIIDEIFQLFTKKIKINK